jgi:hypothetical protein
MTLEDKALGSPETLGPANGSTLSNLSCCSATEQFASTTHVGLNGRVDFGLVDASFVAGFVAGKGWGDVTVGFGVAFDALCA